MKSNQEFRDYLESQIFNHSMMLRDAVANIKEFAKDGIEPHEIVVTAQAEPVNQSNAKMVDSGFRFGSKSKAELVGVLPVLVDVADLALRLSTQDFMIFDGLRTPEEQKRLVAKGMSKTLNSKHLKQKDGYSHAFDAVPVVGSIPKWDWQLIFPVAFAVDRAATGLGVADKIRWGGAWDRTLADFGGDANAYEREVRLYCDRHPGKDFIDGPHFEWVG